MGSSSVWDLLQLPKFWPPDPNTLSEHFNCFLSWKPLFWLVQWKFENVAIKSALFDFSNQFLFLGYSCSLMLCQNRTSQTLQAAFALIGSMFPVKVHDIWALSIYGGCTSIHWKQTAHGPYWVRFNYRASLISPGVHMEL